MIPYGLLSQPWPSPSTTAQHLRIPVVRGTSRGGGHRHLPCKSTPIGYLVRTNEDVLIMRLIKAFITMTCRA